MVLYIIRHGEAVDRAQGEPDEWRYLTKQGRSAVKKIRSKIKKYGQRPDLIITSPLVRAVQTTEILSEKMKKKRTNVIVNGNLKPNKKVSQLIKYLKTIKNNKCVMIIGHNPQFDLLITELISGIDNQFSIKKSSCLALALKFKRKLEAKFLWYLMPGKKIVTKI